MTTTIAIPRITHTPVADVRIGDYVLGSEGFTGDPVVGKVYDIERHATTVRVFFEFTDHRVMQYRMQSYERDGLVRTVEV